MRVIAVPVGPGVDRRGTEGAVSDGDLSLVLGGDHSIATGTVRGVASGRDIGALRLDADDGFNTLEKPDR